MAVAEAAAGMLDTIPPRPGNNYVDYVTRQFNPETLRAGKRGAIPQLCGCIRGRRCALCSSDFPLRRRVISGQFQAH